MDLSTAEVVGAIRDTMDQLNMMWDEIEMQEAERVTRVRRFYENIQELIKDIVSKIF